jgi:hypothetical protein
LLGGGSTSSVHVIPRGGPVKEIFAHPQGHMGLVNNVPAEFVLVEDVVDSDEELNFPI